VVNRRGAKRFTRRGIGLLALTLAMTASWAARGEEASLDEVYRLNQQVVTLYGAGRYQEALPLAKKAVAASETALGHDHPDVATALNNLALLHQTTGDYDRAELLYLRALKIREGGGATDDPAIATELNNLAELYRNRGEYSRAEPLYLRALAIREKALRSGHPDVATSLNNLALLYQAKGDYDRAELLYKRALALREQVLGANHLDTSASLNNLAQLYLVKGAYDQAEPLYQRALAIKEKALGPEHPSVGSALNNLAELYEVRGEYDRAESLFQRALTIKENALGPEHPAVATVLDNLAELYRERGEYARAEPLYLRALAIKEQALGPDHPSVATVLNNLAELYRERGDSARAEPLYQRALKIRENTLGKSHPDVAVSLHNLAELYRERGDYQQAEALSRRALAITEQALGPTHPDVARALNNLGLLNQSQGDYIEAEPLYQRAVAVSEETLGRDHPDVARSLNNLALLYQMRGDLNLAEPLYQRALKIFEQRLGPTHPAVGTLLNNLAELNRERGEIGKAIDLQTRCNDIREKNLALRLATGSEREKVAYIALLAGETDSTISLHTRSAPQNPEALRLALTTVLRRKGRVLDALVDSVAALQRRMDSKDRALLDELSTIRGQLAAAVLNPPSTVNPELHRAQIGKLEAQARELEAAISARSAEFRAQARPVTLPLVQQAIPEHGALVEFVSYRPFTPETIKSDKSQQARRYVAYVLRRHGEPTWAELGEADSIDRQVAQLREAISDPRRTDARALGRTLELTVMRPVRAMLGDTRMVFLAPDGALNLLPFGALVDEDNRFLIERLAFTYLTTGRDLLRLQVKVPNKQGPMIFANPDFNGVGILAASGQTQKMGGASSFRFGPLPGSEGEAQALESVLPGVVILTKAEATEAALKRVHGPRILHLATHGFFLEDQAPEPVQTLRISRYNPDQSHLSVRTIRIKNPLLRSGLALAGANQPQGTENDGVMTALEVAGLDLWGTKLVVLSACETGIGEIQNGEGVYGLRRALVIAGSESQVMSLWKVKDEPTRELMEMYYRRLTGGEGRTEALRQAQLEMLARPFRKHPYYWASFITMGEWDALEQAPSTQRALNR